LTLLTILKWVGLIDKPRTQAFNKLAELIGAGSVIKKSDVTYVGYIGWINANWTGATCEENSWNSSC